jgi:hypothetical protein
MVKKLRQNLINSTVGSGECLFHDGKHVDVTLCAADAFGAVPLADVIWAYSLAQSRGFNVFVEATAQGTAETTDFALIPLVDMMNHDSASPADIRMSIEGSEVVVTANGGYTKVPFLHKIVVFQNHAYV